MVDDGTYADEQGYPKTHCEGGGGGELGCETEGKRVFSVYPFRMKAHSQVGGTVNMGLGLGPGPDPDCTVLKLRVVPL